MSIKFSKLSEMVHDHNSTLSDDKVLMDTISYRGKAVLDFEANADAAGLFGDDVAVQKEGTMTDWAYQQLCGRLGLPHSWLLSDRCPDELEKLNFDWKLKNNEVGNKPLLLRQQAPDIIRAVLSDDYTIYDHITFIEALDEALEMQGIREQVEVIRYEVGDGLRAYCLIEGVQVDERNANNGNGFGAGGDGGGIGGLRPGFYISNNEVGNGRTRIHSAVYRSYCKNGIIRGWKAGAEQFAFVHRGRSAQTMMALMNEAIVFSLNMAEDTVERFLATRYAVIERGRAAGIVDRWASKYGIYKAQKEAWANEVIQWEARNGNVTFFDIVNSLTFNATQTNDVAHREYMEVMAGDMLEAGAPLNYLQTPDAYQAAMAQLQPVEVQER